MSDPRDDDLGKQDPAPNERAADESAEESPAQDDPVSRTIIGPGDDTPSEAIPSAGESLGGWLPSRPGSLHAHPTASVDPLSIEPGGRIGEFVIERTLGRGGFGVVYLARQLSLDRQVALKVSPQADRAAVDGEGRSLARLEHDHIVQVYAEMTEPVTGAHLLCMQYVAGTTLAAVIRELRRKTFGPGGWSGADLLAVLDSIDLPPILFDPAAMRDRDYLAQADHVEAVCRIGEQLARALAHAHARGVLHRDVKPANVLVGRYGRPLLADFNLSIREADQEHATIVGGTLAYMAPEHLDAFNADSLTSAEAINARSDIYSLAVVLWELTSGVLPFPAGDSIQREELSAVLQKLAAERRSISLDRKAGDRRLRNVLSRGLASEPGDRYTVADEFADTLAGLREQRTALRNLPPADRFTHWAWQHPVPALILGGVLPQFVGSALQISYNTLRITLTDEQKDFFVPVAVAYNLIAYPSCLAWLASRLIAVVRIWNAQRRGENVTDERIDEARRRALLLPRDIAIAATVGWLPGAVVFPLALHLGSDPVSAETWGHFFISFGLAWLIAVTYSYFFVLGIVLRTMFIRFWSNPRAFRERSASELASVPDRLRAVNVLAGIIPLAAAVILVLIASPGSVGEGEFDAFRFLTASLILAGMAGYVFVGRRSRRYLEVVDSCTTGESRRVRR
ncbi:MAG: serine/threonine-protein kinase [Planctomycetaceae bacterium]